MSDYRLQPLRLGRHAAGVVTATLAALFLPLAVSASLPPRPDPVKPVEFLGEQARVMVEDLECPFVPSLTAFQSWTCGNLIVEASVVQEAPDQELALRRAVRNAALDADFPQAPVHRADRGLLLVNEESGHAGFVMSDPEVPEEYFTVLLYPSVSPAGDDILPLAQELWAAAGGTELPADAAAALPSLRSPSEISQSGGADEDGDAGVDTGGGVDLDPLPRLEPERRA